MQPGIGTGVAAGGQALSERLCRWRFLAWLCKLCIVLFHPKRGGHPCVYVPERIINRPDPLIYSQFLLMQLGLSVTWRNPDVSIFLAGVPQDTYHLIEDTEYDVVITVHNSSREKAALGTRVEVRWIEFGAGGQIRHPITTVTVDVPVWPGVVKVPIKWRTPPTPGHFCLEIELFHPDDGNPANNRGWNNTQVYAAASQVRTPVRVFNQWLQGCPPIREGGRSVGRAAVFIGWGAFGLLTGIFTAGVGRENASYVQHVYRGGLGYLIGALIGYLFELMLVRTYRATPPERKGVPCNLVEITVDSYEFDDQVGKEANPLVMFAPRAAQWGARAEPNLFSFAPNEVYRDVELIVDAPDGPGPSEVFNVNVMQGGSPTGGVTVTVTRRP
jgi:hypothetical protein